MSKPLIKIQQDKLSLVGSIPQGNPRVISIMGKARMGKSTFLNAIVTHLTRESQAPFKAQDSDDHCTRGIDSYYLESHNLLLLDSQGLDYEDASHDPLLLLFLYLVSDLIIFNDTRRLENGALKLMEPICAFTNYLDIDTVVKPKLYFRIFDSDVKDADKNLEKVLGTYNDQYQSIRNSIKHLFDADIRLLKTEPLDRIAKELLHTNAYGILLEEEYYGFRAAIQQILKASENSTPKTILNKVPDLVNLINNNQEIRIEKLDVVKLQAENDIHKWIEANVAPNMYSSIQVDGTQKTFEENVNPRIFQRDNVLRSFAKRFKDVEDSIRSPYYNQLNEKMTKPIEDAKEQSRKLASDRIAPLLKETQAFKFQEISSTNNSFSTIPDTFWNTFFQPFTKVQNAVATLYNPVKTEVLDWTTKSCNSVKSTVESLREEEMRQFNVFSEDCSHIEHNFKDFTLKAIEKNSMNDARLVTENSKILQTIVGQTMANQQAAITNFIKPKTINFSFNAARELFIQHFMNISSAGLNANYDLTKSRLESMRNNLLGQIASPDFPALRKLIEAKEHYLQGRILSCTPLVGNMIRNNPEIEFISDEIGTNLMSDAADHKIMTKKTHAATYEKVYHEAFAKLLIKGYCKKDDGPLIFETIHNKGTWPSITIQFKQNPNIYEKYLLSLFKHQVAKLYCQKVNTGFVFPKRLDINEFPKNTYMPKKVHPHTHPHNLNQQFLCKSCNKNKKIEAEGCQCVATLYCTECSVGHTTSCPLYMYM